MHVHVVVRCMLAYGSGCILPTQGAPQANGVCNSVYALRRCELSELSIGSKHGNCMPNSPINLYYTWHASQIRGHRRPARTYRCMQLLQPEDTLWRMLGTLFKCMHLCHHYVPSVTSPSKIHKQRRQVPVCLSTIEDCYAATPLQADLTLPCRQACIKSYRLDMHCSSCSITHHR